jgi:integrase/recombinase XerD
MTAPSARPASAKHDVDKAASDEHCGDFPCAALKRATQAWFTHLHVERGRAVNTLLSYRRDIGRYLPFLTARNITRPEQITEREILDFLIELRTGNGERPPLSTASAARTLIAVRGLHAFWLLEGLSSCDPAARVAPPTPAKRLPKAVSPETVLSLIHATEQPDPQLSARDRALLEVLYGSGARISETTALNLEDLDLDSGALRLFGKGRKERIVPLGSFAQQSLRHYLTLARQNFVRPGARVEPAVFLNTLGRRLSRQSAWAVIQAAATRAGITEQLSPHTLRHSYATHLMDGGADIRVVQELLGHACVTTTQIYTMVTAERLREIYAAAHPRARQPPPPASVSVTSPPSPAFPRTYP